MNVLPIYFEGIKHSNPIQHAMMFTQRRNMADLMSDCSHSNFKAKRLGKISWDRLSGGRRHSDRRIAFNIFTVTYLDNRHSESVALSNFRHKKPAEKASLRVVCLAERESVYLESSCVQTCPIKWLNHAI